MRDQAKDARESAAYATSIAVESSKTAQLSVGAALEQLRVMQIQANLASQTLVVQFRPKVTVRFIKFGGTEDRIYPQELDGEIWTTNILLVNTGGTVARVK